MICEEQILRCGWTFRGGRNDGLLGVAQGVKEDLTQIGTFVVVELPFQHVEKETSTIRINNKQKHGSSVQRERDLVLGALHKSPLKPDPVR